MNATNPDVVIVGGGLAGLACAKRLAECGVSFQILEAAARPGGSLRTDLVHGYRLDRTFPILLAASSEARRVFDFDALELKPLARAVLVRFDGQFHRIADPRFEPLSTLQPVGMIRDKLRVFRLLSALNRGNAEQDGLALDLLRWKGHFSSKMIDGFFRPLAGMLFLDRSLATSSRLFQLSMRLLGEGPVAVPAEGMQSLADQLASNLPSSFFRFGTHVDRLGHREVVVWNEAIRARAVVIATGGSEAARLIGDEALAPDSRGTSLLHYAADVPPIAEPILMLDGEGPVNHLFVPSNVSPAYAPEGKSLIVAGTVGVPDDDDVEIDRGVRVQLAEWFGASVSSWQLLRIRRDAEAMPDQPAGTLGPWQKRVRIRPGLYVCGTYCENATMDGILTSGFRAAQAVMEDLHAQIS